MPKTNIGNRVLSLLLVLVMLIGCLPSVFADPPGVNNRSGKGVFGGDAPADGIHYQGDMNWGIRFSLYFAEGGSYDQVIEEGNFTQLGDTKNVIMVNKLTLTRYTTETVYERMVGGSLDRVDMCWTDGSSYYQKNNTGKAQSAINKFPTDIMSENKKTKGEDLNKFWAGVKDVSILEEGLSWSELKKQHPDVDLSNTVDVVNWLLEGSGIKEITQEDWYNGRYTDKYGVTCYGVLKLLYEPFDVFTADGHNFPLTAHDLATYANASYDRTVTNKNGTMSFVTYFVPAFLKLANAVYLDKDEKFLGMTAPDDDLPQSAVKKGNVEEKGTKFVDSYGVGVITGAMHVGTPKIIKTYVKVESIDAQGYTTYKEIKDPEIIYTTNSDFYTYSEYMNTFADPMPKYASNLGAAGFKADDLTNVPKVDAYEHVATPQFTGIAVLNDVQMTRVDLDDATVQWENTRNPIDAVQTVEKNYDDIEKEMLGLIFPIAEVVDQIIQAVGPSGLNVVPGTYPGFTIEEGTNGSKFNVTITDIFQFLSTFDDKLKTDDANELLAWLFNLPEGRIFDIVMTVLKNTFGSGDIKQMDNLAEVELGLADNEQGLVRLLDEDENRKERTDITSTNVLVLRYVCDPEPVQINVVRVEDPDGNIVDVFVEEPLTLEKEGTTVTVQPCDYTPGPGEEGPEQREWVTNEELPYPDTSDGILPPPSEGGKQGTTEESIPDYPIDQNLFVLWVVIREKEEELDIVDSVPEWRLSKYIPSVLEKATVGGGVPRSAYMSFRLTPDQTTHVSTTFDPSGTYNFWTVNPNGKLNTESHSPENMRMREIVTSYISEYGSVSPNTFYHSQAIVRGSDSVSHGKTYARIQLDGLLNQIKSYDTAMINAALWLTSDSDKAKMEEYDIKTDNKPLNYSGNDRYSKNSVLKYGIYNKDTYEHDYTIFYHITVYCGDDDCGGHDKCLCYTSHESFGPSSVNYNTADYDMKTTFDRYVQKNTDTNIFKKATEVKQENGRTSLRYQLTDTLGIYPEVGMIFDDDSDQETLQWTVGDKLRKINPIVWQTLQYKVYTVPNSNGTSVATDTRATAKAGTLGNPDGRKQVIYKGAGVNTAFQLFRDDQKDSKAILTVKTFALDFREDNKYKDLKSLWGNGGYDSYKQHGTLLTNLDNEKTATATEHLLIDSEPFGGLDYTGGDRTQKTATFNRMDYSSQPNAVDGGKAVVFEHRLIVRGAALIGVEYQDRSSRGYTKVPIDQLKEKDEALYEAILEMGLYDESIKRENTVFKTFEFKTGRALTEEKYISDLQEARLKIDGIPTPETSQPEMNKAWYGEDTTVLVIKEYVSNYEVPSISFGDTISMTVSQALNTPIDKSQFFSQIGKGYTYLKYDYKIASVYSPADGGDLNTSVKFEFTSFPGDTYEFGQQQADYLVPNVSITDTTRLN